VKFDPAMVGETAARGPVVLDMTDFYGKPVLDAGTVFNRKESRSRRKSRASR